jgi:hypothetical protein
MGNPNMSDMEVFSKLDELAKGLNAELAKNGMFTGRNIYSDALANLSVAGCDVPTDYSPDDRLC